ncbi:MAG: site-2 protease family protein [Cyanobacteria bacterium SZAS-4]|nr:site-2 protease family protein [Cyanobacteria bacterium SZAS-4]
MYLALTVCFGWIFALCVHEFCHALVAYIGGDKSVKEKGYLTLNPLKYTDPGLTLVVPIVMLMIGGIALPGAAVYINRNALRNKFWHAAVAAAGPFGSALMIFIYALPFMLNVHFSDDLAWLYPALSLLVLLQIIAFFLNSLPIPPLDGYGVIEPFLPGSMRKAMDQFGRYGVWIVFGLLWFVPPLNNALWETSMSIADQLNVPFHGIKIGYAMFSQQKYYLVMVLIVIVMLSQAGKNKKPDPKA